MKYRLFRERSVLWVLVLLGVFAGCQKKAQGPHHFIKLRAEGKITKELFDSAVAVLNARLAMGYDGDITVRAEGKDLVVEVAGRPNLDSLAIVLLAKGGFGMYETYLHKEVTAPAPDAASPAYGMTPAPDGAELFYAIASDTARIRKQYIAHNASLFQASFIWGTEDPYQHAFPLYALKRPSASTPYISKIMIDAARSDFDGSGKPAVGIRLKEAYFDTWSEMTRKNVGRQIAIRFANQVLSAPRVLSEIPGGNSQISGRFTRLQTTLLAAMISSPDLTAALRITHIDTALFVPLRGYPTLRQQARYEGIQAEFLQLKPQIDSLFGRYQLVQQMARQEMEGIYRKDLNTYAAETNATQTQVDEYIDQTAAMLDGVRRTLQGEVDEANTANLRQLLETDPAQ